MSHHPVSAGSSDQTIHIRPVSLYGSAARLPRITVPAPVIDADIANSH
jgi:hypothetical protein